MKRTPEQERIENAMIAGMKLGTDTAIDFMRAGNLRLAPLDFEKGQRPYENKFHPVRATILIWKSWLREKRLK